MSKTNHFSYKSKILKLEVFSLLMKHLPLTSLYNIKEVWYIALTIEKFVSMLSEQSCNKSKTTLTLLLTSLKAMSCRSFVSVVKNKPSATLLTPP